MVLINPQVQMNSSILLTIGLHLIFELRLPVNHTANNSFASHTLGVIRAVMEYVQQVHGICYVQVHSF